MSKTLTVQDVLNTYQPLYAIVNDNDDYDAHSQAHFEDFSNDILTCDTFKYEYYAPAKMYIKITR